MGRIRHGNENRAAILAYRLNLPEREVLRVLDANTDLEREIKSRVLAADAAAATALNRRRR